MIVSICGYENGDFPFSPINPGAMKNSGQVPGSTPGAQPARKSRARRQCRPRKQPNHEPELAPAGSLTRTKALLLAALRVWELKRRIGD
jgi:hypothetical protein